MKKLLQGLVLGLTLALSFSASSQLIYGNTFPFWNVTGPLTVTGYIATSVPRTLTLTTTGTIGATDSYVIGNTTSTITLTLPDATTAANAGRTFCVKTVSSGSMISASSNVAPGNTTTVGTAIVAGTAGKFACLISDAVNWVIFQAN